ncbi:hypothetical protein DFJ74DRAFT_658872 [Hyaloraphidium curvatum]|nr:hypothetical protein DFJ74DRAFT_658872 [Hyaloraphidium curvatum]
MPLLQDVQDEYGGYGIVVEHALKPILDRTDKAAGDIAVVFDKNAMENSGYAEVIAEVTRERVWLVEFYDSDPDPPVRWADGVMEVRDAGGAWHAVRACFKYTTQKPWTRFPIQPRTVVMNSILACIAGGRNKALAARAYDFLNAELAGTGLAIHIPETVKNCSKAEIPLWVESLGGQAVIKVPYSNAGQGVYTILGQKELDDFMAIDHKYEKFIVQSLVGSPSWQAHRAGRQGVFYHVGTVPDKKKDIYVSDLRMMVCANDSGFRPVAIYARRSRHPLVKKLEDHPDVTSWEMLGTNLSVKLDDNEWTTEANRLLLMDRKDFNKLGIGVDDLIDAYVQTVLSIVAIDKMCQKLMKPLKDASGQPLLDERGEPRTEFDWKLFSALCPDSVMLDEILKGNGIGKA